MKNKEENIMAIDNKVRILLQCGYNKFILPEGTSADAISCITHAQQVDTHSITYNENLYTESTEATTIELKIIKGDKIVKFIDNRGKEHRELDIIVDQVTKKLDQKKQKFPVIFGLTNIVVKDFKVEYKTINLADPAFDPEQLINKIINLAMTVEEE